jgi:hypothetical protein
MASVLAIKLLNYLLLYECKRLLKSNKQVYFIHFLHYQMIIIKCTIIIPTSKIYEVWFIYYKVAFETTNCLHPCIETSFAQNSATTWLITCNACSDLFSFWSLCTFSCLRRVYNFYIFNMTQKMTKYFGFCRMTFFYLFILFKPLKMVIIFTRIS